MSYFRHKSKAKFTDHCAHLIQLCLASSYHFFCDSMGFWKSRLWWILKFVNDYLLCDILQLHFMIKKRKKRKTCFQLVKHLLSLSSSQVHVEVSIITNIWSLRPKIRTTNLLKKIHVHKNTAVCRFLLIPL